MVASHAKRRRLTRLGLLTVAVFVMLARSSPLAAAEPDAKHRDVLLRGKVVPMAEALKSAVPDLKADPEPISRQVALVCDDRSVVPLISDEASRALFQDKRLQSRTVEIRGRRFPDLPYLQVITLKVEEGGRFQTPEYFCHVCAISLRYPQTCPCCQGPMEFRMKPGQP